MPWETSLVSNRRLVNDVVGNTASLFLIVKPDFVPQHLALIQVDEMITFNIQEPVAHYQNIRRKALYPHFVVVLSQESNCITGISTVDANGNMRSCVEEINVVALRQNFSSFKEDGVGSWNLEIVGRQSRNNHVNPHL